MTRLLVRIRVHALTVLPVRPLVAEEAWEWFVHFEDLFLGRFDVIKMACLRDVHFQQLVFAPVSCGTDSKLHMVISSVECASPDLASSGVGKLNQCKKDTTRTTELLPLVISEQRTIDLKRLIRRVPTTTQPESRPPLGLLNAGFELVSLCCRLK